MKTVAMITVVALCCVLSFAQCKPHIEFSSDGKPVAIRGLSIYTPDATRKTFTGKVVHITYDDRTGANITGFALENDAKVRQGIDLSYVDCWDSISEKEKGWLPTIIRVGNRVRVDAYITGNAGIVNAADIVVLQTP